MQKKHISLFVKFSYLNHIRLDVKIFLFNFAYIQELKEPLLCGSAETET